MKTKRAPSFSAGKAKEMLKNPPGGRKLTPKQKGLFGLVAGGGTPTRLGGKKRKGY